jgi:hypothetical protein
MNYCRKPDRLSPTQSSNLGTAYNDRRPNSRREDTALARQVCRVGKHAAQRTIRLDQLTAAQLAELQNATEAVGRAIEETINPKDGAMDELDRRDKIVECQHDVKCALAQTLEILRPEIQRKYNFDDEDLRQVVAWAATRLAVESHMAGSDFDEDRCTDLHVHINYLFHGARNLVKDISSESNLDDEGNEPVQGSP